MPYYSAFYRVLLLLWLCTDSRQVLEDIRFCLLTHLIEEGKRNRVVGQSIIQNHLNLLVSESLDGVNDLLAAGVENTSRFGRRLVQLVTMVGKATSATTLKFLEPIFTSSRLAPPPGDSLTQEALSVRQKLGLFCSSLYPLSHPHAGEMVGLSKDGISVGDSHCDYFYSSQLQSTCVGRSAFNCQIASQSGDQSGL